MDIKDRVVVALWLGGVVVTVTKFLAPGTTGKVFSFGAAMLRVLWSGLHIGFGYFVKWFCPIAQIRVLDEPWRFLLTAGYYLLFWSSVTFAFFCLANAMFMEKQFSPPKS
jgi:hypothetical protein